MVFEHKNNLEAAQRSMKSAGRDFKRVAQLHCKSQVQIANLFQGADTRNSEYLSAHRIAISFF
jgi:hypothetical protein